MCAKESAIFNHVLFTIIFTFACVKKMLNRIYDIYTGQYTRNCMCASVWVCMSVYVYGRTTRAHSPCISSYRIFVDGCKHCFAHFTFSSHSFYSVHCTIPIHRYAIARTTTSLLCRELSERYTLATHWINSIDYHFVPGANLARIPNGIMNVLYSY